MAVLVTAISVALIGMLNISTQAMTQLSESKDVAFVQTRIPVDLGSALAASDGVIAADIVMDINDQLGLIGIASPSLTMLDGLPGTNVLTVVSPNTAAPGSQLVVSYRYEQRHDQWVMKRYEFRPGTATPGPTVNLVATELAPPPSTLDPTLPAWAPGDPISFAVDVSPKTIGNRPAGRDVTITFASGRTFTTGGAGLSAARSLPPADGPGLADPLAPPSRCGKRVAIVIDTSGSVPQGSGGVGTETAAIGFIDGFVGTPTQISLNGFDRTGYGMSIDLSNPATVGQRSPFYSVLNDTPEVQGMRGRIAALDDTDGQWASGGSTITPGNPINRADPDGNGIFWGQVGDGTNWEGGLWNVFRNTNGDLYAADQPDLVVFITDGQPNFRRSGPTSTEYVAESLAKDAAVLISDSLRGDLGTRVVGVMVGDKRTNATYVGYLNDVAPGDQWNGQLDATSNAATAGIFLGSFSELGNILRSIVIGECGGTVTLQKRIDSGGTVATPSSGLWAYTSSVAGDTGTRTLDRSTNSSVTFDYTFGPAEATKIVQLTEQPVDGLVWNRAECTAGGLSVPTVPNADGTPGATVTVGADDAVSCLMISSPL